MTTPEGNIKTKIKRMLVEQGVYYFMPVQMGYGAAGLDFHCIVKIKGDMPFPFFIEAKAPGKKPTPRQENLIALLRVDFNCKVWVIETELEVAQLEIWLLTIRGM